MKILSSVENDLNLKSERQYLTLEPSKLVEEICDVMTRFSKDFEHYELTFQDDVTTMILRDDDANSDGSIAARWIVDKLEEPLARNNIGIEFNRIKKRETDDYPTEYIIKFYYKPYESTWDKFTKKLKSIFK